METSPFVAALSSIEIVNGDGSCTSLDVKRDGYLVAKLSFDSEQGTLRCWLPGKKCSGSLPVNSKFTLAGLIDVGASGGNAADVPRGWLNDKMKKGGVEVASDVEHFSAPIPDVSILSHTNETLNLQLPQHNSEGALVITQFRLKFASQWSAQPLLEAMGVIHPPPPNPAPIPTTGDGPPPPPPPPTL